MNNSLNITLELPQEFKDRKINPMIHTSLVWPYIKNNDILFPKRDTKVYYDFGNNEDYEWLIEEILVHKWTNKDLELQVKWMVGDITWELLSYCKDLEALDIYLELQGAKAPWDLLWCKQAINWWVTHCDIPRYMLWQHMSHNWRDSAQGD